MMLEKVSCTIELFGQHQADVQARRGTHIHVTSLMHEKHSGMHRLGVEMHKEEGKKCSWCREGGSA